MLESISLAFWDGARIPVHAFMHPMGMQSPLADPRHLVANAEGGVDLRSHVPLMAISSGLVLILSIVLELKSCRGASGSGDC